MMTARRRFRPILALGLCLAFPMAAVQARQGATTPGKADAPKPTTPDGQDDLTNPITGSKPRPQAPVPAPAPKPATTSEKPATDPTKAPAKAVDGAEAKSQTITAGGLTFEIPAAWAVETPAKSMFTPVAQFRIPPGKSGATEDATVKVFTGIRGGVEPNIERWKSQIGKQDKDAELKEIKVGSLPVHVLYTGHGSFSAGAMMGGADEAKKDYMIAGAIVVLGDGDVQFKAVGPGVLLDAERPHWESMIKSLRVAQ